MGDKQVFRINLTKDKRYFTKLSLKVFLAAIFLTALVLLLPNNHAIKSACATDAKLSCEEVNYEESNTVGKQAVIIARLEIGQPYVYGACHGGSLANMNRKNHCNWGGFDCSSLARWAWYWAGIDIMGRPVIINGDNNVTSRVWQNRESYYHEDFHTLGGDEYSMYRSKRFMGKIKKGDLIYFKSQTGTTEAPGHVAIYSGGGYFIHAPYTGALVREDIWDRVDAVGFVRPAESN